MYSFMKFLILSRQSMLHSRLSALVRALNDNTAPSGPAMSLVMKSKSALHPIMLLVFLTAPFFYLRLHAFDFSKGTSLSLVDLFLFILCAKIAKDTLLQIRSLTYENTKKVLAATFWHDTTTRCYVTIAVLFTLWTCLSAFVGSFLYPLDQPFSLMAFLSGLSQYAFLLLALPLIGRSFIKNRLQFDTSIKYIALGYVPAMILILFVVNLHIYPDLNEMFFYANRAIGTYGNANSFAYVLLITLPFYVYLSHKGGNTTWRALGVMGAALSLVCLVMSGSFGGLLSLAATGAGILGLLLFWKEHPFRGYFKNIVSYLIKLVLLFMLGMGIVVAQNNDFAENLFHRFEPAIVAAEKLTNFHPVGPNLDKRYDKEQEIIESIGSLTQRIELFQIAGDMLASRPGGIFFGHGLRQSFAHTPFHFAGPHQDVHMQFILLWIEGGFVLMLLYVVFLGLIARQVFKAAKNHPAEALMMGTALVAIILTGVMSPHLYLRYFWVPLLPAFFMAQALATTADEKQNT
jgi:hypothetical protein